MTRRDSPPSASAQAYGLTREALDSLSDSAAFPRDPSAKAGVERIQTHISHLFLTRDWVYKFRKPVDLGFVRFASRSERNRDCLAEVALNRRLARDVYRGVAPLLSGPRGFEIGPIAETLIDGPSPPEHCVVMRRLPDGRDALSLLQKRALGNAHIDRLAHAIARFHTAGALGAPAPFSREEWHRRCTLPAEENFRSLAEHANADISATVLGRAEAAARTFAEQHADRFEQRRCAGRAVDGHGDLHLQHVWFESDEAEPLVIDCVEFNEGLRRIDPASEVAFFAMDLAYREATGLGDRFLRVYAFESDDFDLYRVVDYFASYRAGVRAKVAAIAARAPEIAAEQRRNAMQSARRHLELAVAALDPRRGAGLLLVGGAVGTGKSTVAAALADALGGALLSSDRVRKHLLGIPPSARAAPESYTRDAKARVYAGLLARARPVLESGRAAILDATWGERTDRQDALALAEATGVPTRFVEVRCALGVAVERLERRERVGADPSDAGPALHRASLTGFEPLTNWPVKWRSVVRTDRENWRGELERVVQSIRVDWGEVSRTTEH